MKDKIREAVDFVIEHCKIIYPAVLVVAVAVTVVVALTLSNKEQTIQEKESLEIVTSSEEIVVDSVVEVDTSLVLTDNAELKDLFNAYYTAYANGDIEAIRGMTNYLVDTDAMVISEMSKYITSYPAIEVYVKPGPLKDSYLAYVYFTMMFDGYAEQSMPGLETFYVCKDENTGKLYLNKMDVLSDQEVDYINQMGDQDDVLELRNRVEVEFSDIAADANNTALIQYVQEVAVEVKNSVGKILAGAETEEPADNPEVDNPEVTAPEEEETVVSSAKTTATVNVRASDSEKSDKLGKVASGTKVTIVEQKVNGWTHIKYENLDGYIKSEYLKVEKNEKVKPGDVIGEVTATTNVNVRKEANQNSEKLGILSGGTTVELLERQDEWCKINYQGQVGYIKSEFVQ